jgi:hypothetical protein
MTAAKFDESEHHKAHALNMEKLNKDGCEKGRRLEDRINYIESDYKSELVSIRSGQQLFHDDIFPKMQQAVQEAKELAESTDLQVGAASAAARRCETSVDNSQKENRGLMRGFIISIVLLLLASVGKIWQDKVNQDQTSGYLSKLSESMNGLKDRQAFLENLYIKGGHKQ